MNSPLSLNRAQRGIGQRQQFVLLAVITLLAGALRFYKLGQWSFWIDEIYTVVRIQEHYSDLLTAVHNLPPDKNWVPMSLLLTASALWAFGTGEWSARLAPAIIGIASVPILYFPIKKLVGSAAAFLAVLVIAVSPWHLSWSQNARYLTSLVLLYSLSLLLIFLGLERDRPLHIALGLAFFYFALSERLLGFFVAPVVVCYVLLLYVLPYAKPAGLRARNLLILSIPLVVLALVEGYSLLATGSSRFFGDIDWLFLSPTNTPLGLLARVGSGIGKTVLFLGLLGGLYLLARRSRVGLFLLTAAAVPIGLLVVISPYSFTDDRYAFITLPSWVILAAVAIVAMFGQARNWRRLIAAVALVALLADASYDNLLYFDANYGNRPDWRGAFALVGEQSREGDVVVAWWPQLGSYYLGRDIVAWQDADGEQVMQTGGRFWFIVDYHTLWQQTSLKRWVERNAELVEVRYAVQPEALRLRTYLYDPERSASAVAGNRIEGGSAPASEELER